MCMQQGQQWERRGANWTSFGGEKRLQQTATHTAASFDTVQTCGSATTYALFLDFPPIEQDTLFLLKNILHFFLIAPTAKS